MKLKFYLGDLGRGAKLLTADGKVLIEYGINPEFVEYTLYNHDGDTMRAKIILDDVEVIEEMPTTIIDGSVVPSNALPEAPRALPAPRLALPDPEYVEARLDQLRRPFFHDEEQEWEGEEDFMEGLCPDCAQELCLQCGRCNTLHEKQRTAHVFEREGPSSHS